MKTVNELQTVNGVEVDPYSEETAMKYVDVSKPIHIVGASPVKKYKYVDGKRTNEVEAVKYTFMQSFMNEPFAVKFPLDGNYPKLTFYDAVQLEELKAIEVGKYDVYFKATGFKKVGDK